MTTLHIPTLETERLTLRAPARSDFANFAAMLATDRAHHMGGPFDATQSWRLFCSGVASWPLNGYGAWTILNRDTHEFLGDTGITHPLHFPEPELGWTLTARAEGLGYGFEAATAALNWYWTNRDAQTLVSYITPGNTRSEHLARKLGATPDPAAALPSGETRNETTVYRHTAPSAVNKNPPQRTASHRTASLFHKYANAQPAGRAKECK
jgi:RimJ/RimL family protein N-acetyltransferase